MNSAISVNEYDGDFREPAEDKSLRNISDENDLTICSPGKGDTLSSNLRGLKTSISSNFPSISSLANADIIESENIVDKNEIDLEDSISSVSSISEYEDSDNNEDIAFDGFQNQINQNRGFPSSSNEDEFEGFSVIDPADNSLLTSFLNRQQRPDIENNGNICSNPPELDTLTDSSSSSISCTFEGFGMMEDTNKMALRQIESSKFEARPTWNKSPTNAHLKKHLQKQGKLESLVPISNDLITTNCMNMKIKPKEEVGDFIGPYCQAIGCTVSWLETDSPMTSPVEVNNAIVFELSEFAKKIAWEREYVAYWIMRLQGVSSESSSATEEDLNKINMVVKRKKAISVTFSGKNLLKPKLAAFDAEKFILPSLKNLDNFNQDSVEFPCRNDQLECPKPASCNSNISKSTQLHLIDKNSKPKNKGRRKSELHTSKLVNPPTKTQHSFTNLPSEHALQSDDAVFKKDEKSTEKSFISYIDNTSGALVKTSEAAEKEPTAKCSVATVEKALSAKALMEAPSHSAKTSVDVIEMISVKATEKTSVDAMEKISVGTTEKAAVDAIETSSDVAGEMATNDIGKKYLEKIGEKTLDNTINESFNVTVEKALDANTENFPHANMVKKTSSVETNIVSDIALGKHLSVTLEKTQSAAGEQTPGEPVANDLSEKSRQVNVSSICPSSNFVASNLLSNVSANSIHDSEDHLSASSDDDLIIDETLPSNDEHGSETSASPKSSINKDDIGSEMCSNDHNVHSAPLSIDKPLELHQRDGNGVNLISKDATWKKTSEFISIETQAPKTGVEITSSSTPSNSSEVISTKTIGNSNAKLKANLDGGTASALNQSKASSLCAAQTSLHVLRKAELARTSFGQHIKFASKKGKADFTGKNVQYPIFEVRDNVIGPYCNRVELSVKALNAPSRKIHLTNGMIIELYIYFKERGATLTSLVQKIHQLTKTAFDVNLIQLQMAKIQEVVNTELQKKTEYFLDKEFSFLSEVAGTPKLMTKQVMRPIPTPKIVKNPAMMTNKGHKEQPYMKNVPKMQIDEVQMTDAPKERIDSSLLADFEKSKGKVGGITRGDIVSLYYSWLQLKNKDKESVFVIDLLSDVEKLMLDRKIEVIRIPVGMLMSSSVKLFEEYQQYRASSPEDALAYLEDDWLDDINCLLASSKRRKVADEIPHSTTEKSTVEENPVNAFASDSASENFHPQEKKSNKGSQKRLADVSFENKHPEKRSKLSSENELSDDLCEVYPPLPVITSSHFTDLTFEYRIERVVTCRLSYRNGKAIYDYLIEWKGESPIDDTWVEEKDFPPGCSFIAKFWENNPERRILIDKIMSHKVIEDSQQTTKQYLVSWQTYNSSSWITEQDFAQSSRKLLDEYNQTHNLGSKQRETNPEGTEDSNQLSNTATVPSSPCASTPKKIPKVGIGESHDAPSQDIEFTNGQNCDPFDVGCKSNSIESTNTANVLEDSSEATSGTLSVPIDSQSQIETQSKSRISDAKINANDLQLLTDIVETEDLENEGISATNAEPANEISSTNDSQSSVDVSSNVQHSDIKGLNIIPKARESVQLLDKGSSSASSPSQPSKKYPSNESTNFSFKRKPREEMLTDEEKAKKMEVLKSIPLMQVMRQSECMQFSELVVQHAMPEYDPASALHLGKKFRHFTNGKVLSIYDEWRKLKKAKVDDSLKSFQALRDKIKECMESDGLLYDYDDCLLGLCYSLYLTRSRLASMTDLMTFNSCPCIETIKAFKAKHSDVLHKYYNTSDKSISSRPEIIKDKPFLLMDKFMHKQSVLNQKICSEAAAEACQGLATLKENLADLDVNSLAAIKNDITEYEQGCNFVEKKYKDHSSSLDNYNKGMEKHEAKQALRKFGYVRQELKDLLSLVAENLQP